MPIISADEVVRFKTHGSTFSSYVAPSRGSEQLCAWRLEVPANTPGTTHRLDREEVILVLDGRLHVVLGDQDQTLDAGDVVLVPRDVDLRVDAGPRGATAWVTTTAGLAAVTADGTRIEPPWAN